MERIGVYERSDMEAHIIISDICSIWINMSLDYEVYEVKSVCLSEGRRLFFAVQ
jgi:hypothetical protein